MERLIVNLLIIGIGILILFGMELMLKKIKTFNYNKDLKYRQNDTLLAKYFSEMITDRNDGWIKQHYRNLYTHRFNKLKNKK